MLREVVCRRHTLRLGATGLGCLILVCSNSTSGQSRSHSKASSAIPNAVLIRIVKAEDERRCDNDLSSLLGHSNSIVRQRAALAAGRIGDVEAVQPLVSLMQKDSEQSVRAMAAFALGEIEAGTATEALIAQLGNEGADVRGRAVEALGKIAAALPKTEESLQKRAGEAILRALKDEATRRPAPETEVILLGLTAALRARPDGAGKMIAGFLVNPDARVRADAANALARLRAKDGNEQLRKLLTNDTDPVVRANAARVLGATEDRPSVPILMTALTDKDSRVRVSSIRSLAALKDPQTAGALEGRGKELSKNLSINAQGQINEVLEIAIALGRIQQGTNIQSTLAWFKELQSSGLNHTAPEVEIAFVRVSATAYLESLGAYPENTVRDLLISNPRAASGLAAGLGEIAALPDSAKDKASLAAQAQGILRAMLDFRIAGINSKKLAPTHPEYAIPDVLRAYAAFKPTDLKDVLVKHLREQDVVVRATAAELIGELPQDAVNEKALRDALLPALSDAELNDAALAIIDALGKQKTESANNAIRTALDSNDHVVNMRVRAILKDSEKERFAAHAEHMRTRNKNADYERAIARIGKTVHATVNTTKGSFVIELLPEDAPMNVDNFVQLAKRGYFKGITFHRVVPNFVIQGGDPRGDGNGGPGYQIRCEINEVPYERGAVGMALSGKDTGGSQWFVTHSRQPHLDGGYTVFGRVVEGMDVVDSIVRGDTIRSIVVSERARK